MDFLNEFIVNNYVWITIVCLFLIFTLIGYISDKNKSQNEVKETNKVKPSPVVKNEEIKEIINNEVKALEENDENNSGEISKPVELGETEEVYINNEIKSEEQTSKTLEELMAENDISETPTNLDEIPIKTEETKTIEDNNEQEVEGKEESVNEETPKNVEVVNSWEPELTVENKDIASEKDDKKEDSI